MPSYGVRLLLLAAKWRAQAFWVGDGRPTAVVWLILTKKH